MCILEVHILHGFFQILVSDAPQTVHQAEAMEYTDDPFRRIPVERMGTRSPIVRE
jgi:hypothetical protein